MSFDLDHLLSYPLFDGLTREELATLLGCARCTAQFR